MRSTAQHNRGWRFVDVVVEFACLFSVRQHLGREQSTRWGAAFQSSVQLLVFPRLTLDVRSVSNKNRLQVAAPITDTRSLCFLWGQFRHSGSQTSAALSAVEHLATVCFRMILACLDTTV